MIELLPSRTVAIEILSFPVHWYGIMYLCGFLLAFFLASRMQKYRGLDLTKDQWSTIISWGIIGVLIGGRLGYVLFYEPSYFLSHPWDIPAVWKGGMASHGGFIGVTITMILVLRKYNVPLLAIADTLSIPVALGLAFGRVGNFINQELYGIPTTLPWGIEIPGVEELRHPTQLYAVAKDICIALACFGTVKMTKTHGMAIGVFLVLYGILRFLVENLRVQDYPNTQILGMEFTRGQLLTIPLFLAGVCVLLLIARKNLRKK